MTYKKPLPQFITREAKQFYTECRDHTLRIQQCSNCGRLRHYPKPMCSDCNSLDYSWQDMSGRGIIYTWTTTHHPFRESLAVEVPYIVAIVELEEGIQLITNIVSCPPEDLYIGMPVEVVFTDVTDKVVLPQFTPTAAREH